MPTPIAIKPHHFVDILTEVGAGRTSFEPHPYGHAVHTVATALLRDPDATVRIELGADDICAPCVHNVDGVCVDTIDTSFRPDAPESKREWNLLIDERWCERIGVEQGDVMSARELCGRIRGGMRHAPDIYREMPADGTSERMVKLETGARQYLDG